MIPVLLGREVFDRRITDKQQIAAVQEFREQAACFDTYNGAAGQIEAMEHKLLEEGRESITISTQKPTAKAKGKPKQTANPFDDLEKNL